MRRFIAYGPALVVLVTTLAVLIAAPAAVRTIGYAANQSTVTLARQTLEQDDILERVNRQVRAIADSVSPSVVNIATAEVRGRRAFRVGQGSGWILDDQGHIITNSHVVKGASDIVVQFPDGRQVDAELVGRDATTDIAVLKIKSTEGLIPIQRASGEKLHQGDRVYAFGSPFGFKFSMSEGIVSGLGRDPQGMASQSGYTNYIQTDAAVNPGNSGGPLVDIHGKLVGMNVAIATGTTPSGSTEFGQSAGISFAIPLDTIEFVVDQLINNGRVSKGFLGISHPGNDDLNAAALSSTDFKGRGVVVTDVVPDGPAAQAGLEKGDIITTFNDYPVFNVPGLRSAITNCTAGKQVQIQVWRNGETLTLRPTLGTLPPTRVDLRETLDSLQRFGINDLAQTRSGAIIISDVMVPSRAANTGFKPGMVITKIEGKPVTSLEDLLGELAGAGLHQGRAVSVQILERTGLTDADEKTLTITNSQ